MGRGECWSRSRVSDTKHNTLFIVGRHLHDAREGKKCTLLYQKLFQYYGNAHLKRVNWKFCAASGGALFSWHTLRRDSLLVCACDERYCMGICSEAVCLWMCTVCCLSPIGMLPIVRLEAALSIEQQKALSQMFALCRYTAFPLEWSMASSAKTKCEKNGEYNEGFINSCK